jgi:hypothetical protein
MLLYSSHIQSTIKYIIHDKTQSMLHEFYCITSNSARNWHVQEKVATLERRDGMIRNQKHVKSGDLFIWLMYLQKLYTCYIYKTIKLFFNLYFHSLHFPQQKYAHANLIHKYMYKKVYIRAAQLQTTETICFPVHPPKHLPCSDPIIWIIKHEHINKNWTDHVQKHIFKSNIGRLYQYFIWFWSHTIFKYF